MNKSLGHSTLRNDHHLEKPDEIANNSLGEKMPVRQYHWIIARVCVYFCPIPISFKIYFISSLNCSSDFLSPEALNMF